MSNNSPGRVRAGEIESALATEAPQSRPLTKVFVVLVTIAAFGPYIWGGIRTEQAFVYGIGLFILPFSIAHLRLRAGLGLFIPWALYILVASLGVAFPTLATAKWVSGDFLSGFDNVILPLIVMLLVWSTVPPQAAPQLLNIVARIVTVAMAANGAIAIVSTRFDLTPVLRPFWATAGSAGSTGELAATLGRFSGVFNHPAEAGAMYGIAGLLGVYVWASKPRLVAFLLTLIVLGGLVTVSKVFIIGALPLILFYWIRAGKGSSKLGLLFGAVLVTLGIIQSGLLSKWTGFNYLARLLNPDSDGGALAFYTAGRLADDSGMAQVVAEAIRINPVSGVGAAGWRVAYDSAITESLVVGGVLGLLCHLATLIGLFVLAARTENVQRRTLTFLFAILIAGASLGFTPLNANRVATVVWLVVSLFVLAREAGKSDDAPHASNRRPLSAARNHGAGPTPK